ncbi:UNKNOWN [Stylonychia lemnae]|uniref:Uncharacterized protein n=1 Tax=Stylonychia lemnae TaxID=5949 RepID=A0A078ARE9_STYLE|nr:UNKNOWN [Stylonychia lemnae]|eukprot:CDW85030.1 UNKNOWN [Stylonychia lemnae]
MDDDWFQDDSQIDSRQLELKLAENEQKRNQRDQWNKGYLDGLEWADKNYSSYDLNESDSSIQDLREHFDKSVEEGRFAYLLLADNLGPSFDEQRNELRQMMEQLNLGLKNQDQSDHIVNQSRELRQKINKDIDIEMN